MGSKSLDCSFLLYLRECFNSNDVNDIAFCLTTRIDTYLEQHKSELNVISTSMILAFKELITSMTSKKFVSTVIFLNKLKESIDGLYKLNDCKEK